MFFVAQEEQERIVIPDEEGNEHLFDVLFTFDVDETEKSYIVLTEAMKENEEEEEVEVFAFEYKEDGKDDSDITLIPIETESEWDMVEEMIETFSASEDI